MNYITTTNLRTHSKELVESLKQGKKVEIIHRSKVIGEILPAKEEAKTFDIKKFRKFIKKPVKKDLSYQEREQIYRQHLEEKYGKNLS